MVDAEGMARRRGAARFSMGIVAARLKWKLDSKSLQRGCCMNIVTGSTIALRIASRMRRALPRVLAIFIGFAPLHAMSAEIAYSTAKADLPF